jgi:hypothetical protein
MARQRAWADSMSLNAIATPAAREPGPLGDALPKPHGGEGGLDRVGGAQVDPVLGRGEPGAVSRQRGQGSECGSSLEV